MGDMTRILITGASGFVGRACVTAARAQGIEVVAMYRRDPAPEWGDDAGITPLQLDLSDADAQSTIARIAPDLTAVIHAAAHLGGNRQAHLIDTEQATQTLLNGLQGAQTRLVLVGSIAVYDTMQVPAGGALTETSPTEAPSNARDAYTAAKLAQENLCRASGLPLWIMRPGAIYGPGRTWPALQGFGLSKLFVMITSDGELPLTHVDTCAEMLLRAAKQDPEGVKTLNIVDSNLPDRRSFVSEYRRLTGWPQVVLPLPFALWLRVVRLIKPFAAKLPGLFQEPICRARLMPLSYPNTALIRELGQFKAEPFTTVLARSLEDTQ